MKKLMISIMLMTGAGMAPASAQLKGLDVVKVPEARQPYSGENIQIPDVDGYKALKCDFHAHTIFSDGDVRPEIRVWEAAIRGLDVLAITDHVEYRPHKYITADHNEAYKLAKIIEKNSGVLVVHGAEITRFKPLGHINALFIEDGNVLDVKDPLDAIDRALEQGAFIMWNHPGWPNDSSTIYPVHKKLIKQKKIHGVELVNGWEYYPKAFNFCHEYGLTYLGNTDIHGAYKQSYRTDRQYGPMTIVFAKEKTEKSVKEALFAGRTVVKFGSLLIGPEAWLKALAKSCLQGKIEKKDSGQLVMKLINLSSIDFDLHLDNKVVPVPGQTSAELLLGNAKEIIRLDNAYITDSMQLEMEAGQFVQ